MRLLHTKDLHFKEFVGQRIPDYGIISHRWGDEEVTFQCFVECRQQFIDGQCTGYGWIKIAKACEIAKERNLEWVWIDTCCMFSFAQECLC